VGIFILIAEKIRTGSVKWGKHEIPFGPFLIIGALAAYFFGITLWTFLGV
jgi:prepilin signal peptidase PulO-like enzyme (type II secretory pathway)